MKCKVTLDDASENTELSKVTHDATGTKQPISIQVNRFRSQNVEQVEHLGTAKLHGD